ncbi:MAG: hypothetical protein OK457_00630 [Thaumarchaeota archaeon]|nr:hypothetical protein [Nitrososphaerota archaeon]
MSDATLTPEEIGEIVGFLREHSELKLDKGQLEGVHPRTLLELIRKAKKDEE